ncbi:MAG: hypothetical protein PWP17_978, partial [Desulfomicrobiaceae bacterium]|nr:hypothetical protein [Desulfomicrobiaceae bacterium]
MDKHIISLSECMTRFEGIKTLNEGDVDVGLHIASECMTRFEGIKTHTSRPTRHDLNISECMTRVEGVKTQETETSRAFPLLGLGMFQSPESLCV